MRRRARVRRDPHQVDFGDVLVVPRLRADDALGPVGPLRTARVRARGEAGRARLADPAPAVERIEELDPRRALRHGQADRGADAHRPRARGGAVAAAVALRQRLVVALRDDADVGALAPDLLGLLGIPSPA